MKRQCLINITGFHQMSSAWSLRDLCVCGGICYTDNKEWEWEGKKKKKKIDDWIGIGQLGTASIKKQSRHRLRGAKEWDCRSLLWFICLLSPALVGVNGGCHACTLATFLSLCLGNGASPRGQKGGRELEFGISICHLSTEDRWLRPHKSPSCWAGSSVPVVLNDLSHSDCRFPLSLFFCLLWMHGAFFFLSFHQFSSFLSRRASNRSNIWEGSVSHSLLSNYCSKWTEAERSVTLLIAVLNPMRGGGCNHIPFSPGQIGVRDRTDAGVYAG